MSRSYCFTINNPTEEERNLIKYCPEPIRYLIAGDEVGEKGTPHIQGYMELTKVMRITGVHKILGFERAHLESRRSTREQARDYCMKDKQFIERGDWKAGGRGTRNDLRNVMEMVRDGKSMTEVMEEHPIVVSKHMKFVDRYTQLIEKEQTKDFRKVQTHVLQGDAGTGKSRIARELASEAGDYFVVNAEDAVPFDGYNGEKTIILDDFYGGLRYHHLLNILDGHQQRVNVKYGHRYAKWTTVFITSNNLPCLWYERGLTDALARRLTTVTMFQCNEVGGNSEPPLLGDI